MNFFSISVLVFALFPLSTNTIRCYKCDATKECRTISSAMNDYSSDNLEVIDCEYFCWKSVSLGNVYRGCAKKRCAISHTVGSFSSSVCCQADYCNESHRLSTSNYFLLTIIFSLLLLVRNY